MQSASALDYPQNIEGKVLLPSYVFSSATNFNNRVFIGRDSGLPLSREYSLEWSSDVSENSSWQKFFPAARGESFAGFTDEISGSRKFFRLQQSDSESVRLKIRRVATDVFSTLNYTFLRGWETIVEMEAPGTESGWVNANPTTIVEGSVAVRHALGIAPQFQVTAIPPIIREDYEAILVGGQSNALLYEDRSFPERESNVVYIDEAFEFIHPSKYHDGMATNIYKYSFALAAAAQLAETRNIPVLLVPVAVGATTIRQWFAGTNRFDRQTLFGRANLRRVIASPKPIRTIWYYGHESSASSPGIETYDEDWEKLIGEFQRETGPTPLIYAQLAKSTEPGVQHDLFTAAEKQRRAEKRQAAGSPGHFMVVTFDLALGDPVHLNGAAFRELGKRFALATREHVYGEGVNGTGPRLVSVQFTDSERRTIKVEFDRPINAAVNAYDEQFSLSPSSADVQISVVRRHESGTAVEISLDNPGPAGTTLSYGAKPAERTQVFLTNVVRDLSGLPAPAFGPLTVP